MDFCGRAEEQFPIGGVGHQILLIAGPFKGTNMRTFKKAAVG